MLFDFHFHFINGIFFFFCPDVTSKPGFDHVHFHSDRHGCFQMAAKWPDLPKWTLVVGNKNKQTS